jgi:predicted nuclease of predicted toxin-antitoxin system
MLRFLIDTQLPPSLAYFLKKLGYDAVHTIDFPKGTLLDDKEIRTIAIQQERIVVTKDNDFFDYYFLKGKPKTLILEIGNIKNKDLFHLIQTHHHQLKRFFKKSGLVILKKDKIVAY